MEIILFIIFDCRVAVQNERYDEWSSTIILLKRLFNEYQETVLKYHEKSGLMMPKAINSTASQGNFLEVLNMSLNGLLLFFHSVLNIQFTFNIETLQF